MASSGAFPLISTPKISIFIVLEKAQLHCDTSDPPPFTLASCHGIGTRGVLSGATPQTNSPVQVLSHTCPQLASYRPSTARHRYGAHHCRSRLHCQSDRNTRLSKRMTGAPATTESDGSLDSVPDLEHSRGQDDQWTDIPQRTPMPSIGDQDILYMPLIST